jgi:hypothetical protein
MSDHDQTIASAVRPPLRHHPPPGHHPLPPCRPPLSTSVMNPPKAAPTLTRRVLPPPSALIHLSMRRRCPRRRPHLLSSATAHSIVDLKDRVVSRSDRPITWSDWRGPGCRGRESRVVEPVPSSRHNRPDLNIYFDQMVLTGSQSISHKLNRSFL